MILIACLIWVGVALNAPTWFYILLGVSLVIKLFNYGMAVGKVVGEKSEDN